MQTIIVKRVWMSLTPVVTHHSALCQPCEYREHWSGSSFRPDLLESINIVVVPESTISCILTSCNWCVGCFLQSAASNFKLTQFTKPQLNCTSVHNICTLKSRDMDRHLHLGPEWKKGLIFALSIAKANHKNIFCFDPVHDFHLTINIRNLV